jgi:Tfp pilus assembly protein PilF
VLRIYLAINLADWRMSQGEHAQAQAELRAVLDDEGLRDALYRDPYQLAMVHCAMAKARWGAGELEQAEAAFREAVTVAEGWGRDKNITNSMLRDFEQFLAAQGRHVEAAELCKRRLEHLKKLVAEADEKEKKGKHGGGRSKSLVERDQQQRTMTEIQSLESKT